MRDAPCYNCELREVGCHASCKAYAEYNKKNKDINKEKLNKIDIGQYTFTGEKISKRLMIRKRGF